MRDKTIKPLALSILALILTSTVLATAPDVGNIAPEDNDILYGARDYVFKCDVTKGSSDIKLTVLLIYDSSDESTFNISKDASSSDGLKEFMVYVPLGDYTYRCVVIDKALHIAVSPKWSFTVAGAVMECHYDSDLEDCVGSCEEGLECVETEPGYCECIDVMECHYDFDLGYCVGSCEEGLECIEVDEGYCECVTPTPPSSSTTTTVTSSTTSTTRGGGGGSSGGGGGGSSGGGGSRGGVVPSGGGSCFDGLKNCHHHQCEEDVDCGGPCDPCPTCSDGIQNQGEKGIDCGGPCPPCKTTTTTTSVTTTTKKAAEPGEKAGCSPGCGETLHKDDTYSCSTCMIGLNCDSICDTSLCEPESWCRINDRGLFDCGCCCSAMETTSTTVAGGGAPVGWIVGFPGGDMTLPGLLLFLFLLFLLVVYFLNRKSRSRN